MKILFCLNYDIFSIISLNLLLPFLEKNKFSFSIVMTKSVGQSVVSDVTKIEKIIPIEGIFKTIDFLNITRKYFTLNQIVKEYDCGFNFVETINNNFGLDLIERHDLILSIRFGSIFKQAAIQKAKKKIINVHSAILPDYRGILGTFRALQDKKETIGATIHNISDATIDTGDIIKIVTLKANYQSTLFDNLLALYQKTIPVLTEVLVKVAGDNTIQPYAQNINDGKYFSNPTSEEINTFKEKIMPIYNDNDINRIIELFGNNVKKISV